MIRGLLAATLAVVAISGCSRGAGTATPTASDGVPPPLRLVVVDFPSAWLAERVGGDAVDVLRVSANEVAGSDADLLVYVPGIDAAVDSAAASLPAERVVDLVADISRIADPRDAELRDPYVWFDPVNVATMANTLGTALADANKVPFAATQYYGVRSLQVESEALLVDQRLQEQLNPCRIETLVVEAPVLGYLAKAYAFTQIPLVAWRPARDPVRALYFTLDAEPAVRSAARAADVRPLPVDTLTERAPGDDLLQGVTDLGDRIAAHQDCPLVTPGSTDRPR